jgi:CPA1 family monovalent cation:H+ antiporter
VQPELAFVALFSVATAVALIARRLRVPYTVALVVTGLLLGSAHVLHPPHLTKELLYAVFLPGLVFETAFALELKHFRANVRPILSLALPGLVVAVVLTAGLLVPVANGLHVVEAFSLGTGLVFASLIAATDPIAVVALFKGVGAPGRLRILIEGESLLNDGTAVVVFTLVLGAVTGGGFELMPALLEFSRVVGMGVLIGAAVGFAASEVIRRVDDPMIEITLTTIAAYGSFVAAEHFHNSGVIATVTAGMLCGNYAARAGMTASTRVAVSTFWEYLAFALNSIVFLLIGFEVQVGALLTAWKPIVVAYLAVTVGRALVVYAVTAIARRSGDRMPWSWGAVLTWGGLRGGLSMVLVLAIPPSIPHRDLLVTMTFGVVVLSILLQGMTMGTVLRRLGLVAQAEGRREYERLRGALKAVRSAKAEIERASAEGSVSHDTADQLMVEYDRRLGEIEAAVKAMHGQTAGLQREEQTTLQRRALVAEKDAILLAFRAGELSEEAYDELLADVDARLFELEKRES